MFRSHKSPIVPIIFAAVIGLILIGCSPSAQSPTVANTAAPAVPTTAPTVEAAPTVDTEETEATATTGDTTSSETATCSLLNLNTLTEDQLLATIPNFSNRMVREFFEYRPYVSIQQFRREIGKYVDEEQVAEYEQYVYVPVDPNNADAETLMQLPGVDDAIAASLIEGRPYASNDAFLAALANSVTAEQSAQAVCLLSV